ncbi:formimidoylglutamate deiminase [Sphingomonas sp. VNH70]|uniref:formimidoylglutamate deiminase n=1 Tax=Sphingomonas silueang TaxID=3156617 RepID=UPI0032B59BFA
MTDLWFEQALLPDGWARDVRIRVAHGRIAAVLPGSAPEPGDERHAVALPGQHNVHSHAFQRAMAGLTERRGQTADSFWTWRDLMYRFAHALDPETMQAVAELAFVEMLEAGYTRCGEFHYVHHAPGGKAHADPAAMARAIAQAAAATGIGLTLLPVFYAAAGFGGQPPSDPQRRFVSSVDGFARLLDATETATAGLPDAVVGIAPHSLRAAPPAMLAAVTALRPAAPIHIHVAEQVKEVEDCIAWSGRRPVQWLLDEAGIDERWCLIHATHVTPQEIDGIVASGATVGLCPITEANLGDGIFPAAAFVAAGGRFGIGTDSNVSIDVAGELRLLEYGQRLVRRERNVLAQPGASTGRTLFDHSLRGGVQALGVAGAGICPGASADLVSLAPGHPAIGGREGDAVLDGWIFAAGAAAIDCVWRRGAAVVRQGRHVARDAVLARYRPALHRLMGGE